MYDKIENMLSNATEFVIELTAWYFEAMGMIIKFYVGSNTLIVFPDQIRDAIRNKRIAFEEEPIHPEPLQRLLRRMLRIIKKTYYPEVREQLARVLLRQVLRTVSLTPVVINFPRYDRRFLMADIKEMFSGYYDRDELLQVEADVERFSLTRNPLFVFFDKGRTRVLTEEDYAYNQEEVNRVADFVELCLERLKGMKHEQS